MFLTLASRCLYPLQQSGGAELTVTIVACGPCPNVGANYLIYAVTVTQPVQCWTVIRSHDDFRSLGDALSSIFSLLPPCPLLSSSDATGDLAMIVKARNELQVWLADLLMYPGAHESLAVNNFLTLGANTLPAQYETVAWTQFNLHSVPSPINSSNLSSQNSGNVNVDDMEMDDMFFADDDNAPTAQDDQDDLEEFIPAASVRYKPTDEAVTDEEEMEILQLAGEVEMIEDIGSLAQSLGASHLGRSLQLQAEKKHVGNKNNSNRLLQPGLPQPQQGLNIGGSGSQLTPVVGGIGSAMEHAAKNAHFNHKPPVSAPRLDSFKMIKVIGKGSFGKQQ
jgi:hypothetical protein